MWSLINVSSNLHTTDVKLTGLFFSGFFLDTFLNNSVMFASFQGIIPSSSNKLNNFASGVLICSIMSCFGGIYYTLSLLSTQTHTHTNTHTHTHTHKHTHTHTHKRNIFLQLNYQISIVAI